MISAIDHIVIGVHDLDQARRDYEALGFTVQPGGAHTGGATHNALIGFQDGTYFELIAFTDPSQPADHRWWERIAAGEGLIDFALLSDDVDGGAAALADAGIPNDGPVDGGRARPDGQEVGWRNLIVPDGLEAGIPFVIQDRTPRALRVPGGTATVHAGGFQAVDGVTVAVPDLPHAVKAYTAMLGDRGVATEPTVNGSKAAHRFVVGEQWIELNEPDQTDSPLRQAVARRGGSLWSVVLRTTDRSFAGIDDRLSHGARIELVQ